MRECSRVCALRGPSGARDPKALGTLVSSLGIPQERVNADLLTYKGVLSRLQAAKEIMKVDGWLALILWWEG
jgi:hypothetical protein